MRPQRARLPVVAPALCTREWSDAFNSTLQYCIGNYTGGVDSCEVQRQNPPLFLLRWEPPRSNPHQHARLTSASVTAGRLGRSRIYSAQRQTGHVVDRRSSWHHFLRLRLRPAWPAVHLHQRRCVRDLAHSDGTRAGAAARCVSSFHPSPGSAAPLNLRTRRRLISLPWLALRSFRSRPSTIQLRHRIPPDACKRCLRRRLAQRDDSSQPARSG